MDCLRVKLRDGRMMAYKETGVPKESAKFKIIVIHGLGSCRQALFPCSEELMQKQGIYMVGFDRAGYGNSDPFPQRTVESEAYDIQDLADHLGLGPKFYIIGISMGGYSAWSCLNYIPHRIAGAALVVPAINFWWPCFPKALCKEAFNRRILIDKVGLRIAHYLPWLHLPWSILVYLTTDNGLSNLHKHDQEVLSEPRMVEMSKEALKQGPKESTNRDMITQFSDWGFDPTQVKQPGPDVRVEIWQGDEDYLVPADLQRYIHQKLPWTEYHEFPQMGHLFFVTPDHSDNIVKSLLNVHFKFY